MDNICPYCNGKILYSKSSKMIYGKDYGGIYYCENFPICNSYVGVHKNTKKSLGTIANESLRKKRKEAHYYFDFLWKIKYKKGYKNARTLAYKWLSKKMNINIKNTHIGMFNEEECDKVINICKPYVIKITKKVKK